MPFVRDCETLLNKSARMKQILDNHSIFNSKRQAKNLKRLLTKSKFDTITEVPRVYKCGDKRCKVCPDLIEGTRIELKNGHHFEVRKSMTCTSTFVIYTLICKACGDFYVGKTSNMIRTRMTVHRQQTRNDDLRFLKVNKHFHLCSGGKFNIFPIYKVCGSSEAVLDEKEKLLISILKPTLNA